MSISNIIGDSVAECRWKIITDEGVISDKEYSYKTLPHDIDELNCFSIDAQMIDGEPGLVIDATGNDYILECFEEVL